MYINNTLSKMSCYKFDFFQILHDTDVSQKKCFKTFLNKFYYYCLIKKIV